LAITIKGPTSSAPPQATGLERNAAADAYARLAKKGGERSKRAAKRVGDVLDELVHDEDATGSELEAARHMIDEVGDDLPQGPPMARAEAVAERLKQKIETTRGQRGQLAQRMRQAFDELDE
jgi:hypothetical protein